MAFPPEIHEDPAKSLVFLVASEADGLAWLASVPVFRRLERCELPLLAAAFQKGHFGAGEVVFRKGDPPEAFYVIQGGDARVLDENEGLIAVLNVGDYFGEAALLSQKPRNATVQAGALGGPKGRRREKRAWTLGELL